MEAVNKSPIYIRSTELVPETLSKSRELDQSTIRLGDCSKSLHLANERPI